MAKSDMEDKRKKIVSAGMQGLMVTISLLAIIIFANSPIVVTSSPDSNAAGSKSKLSEIHLEIASNIPSGGNSMAKTEPIGTGRTMFLTIPAFVVVYNFNETKPNSRVIELKTSPKTTIHFIESLSTTASISAEKAMEFTLVGAKPSGTS